MSKLEIPMANANRRNVYSWLVVPDEQQQQQQQQQLPQSPSSTYSQASPRQGQGHRHNDSLEVNLEPDFSDLVRSARRSDFRNSRRPTSFFVEHDVDGTGVGPPPGSSGGEEPSWMSALRRERSGRSSRRNSGGGGGLRDSIRNSVRYSITGLSELSEMVPSTTEPQPELPRRETLKEKGQDKGAAAPVAAAAGATSATVHDISELQHMPVAAEAHHRDAPSSFDNASTSLRNTPSFTKEVDETELGGGSGFPPKSAPFYRRRYCGVSKKVFWGLVVTAILIAVCTVIPIVLATWHANDTTSSASSTGSDNDQGSTSAMALSSDSRLAAASASDGDHDGFAVFYQLHSNAIYMSTLLDEAGGQWSTHPVIDGSAGDLDSIAKGTAIAAAFDVVSDSVSIFAPCPLRSLKVRTI